MDSALLTARVLLAVVFTVAGLAKLADRAGSRQAIRNFGVPALLAAPLGVLLPLAELAVAVALVPRASAWWGAAGALAFLLLFIAGIGVNLARGRTPDCHCFGQLYSAPIGWPTLVRNAILAAIAGFVLWQGRDDAGRSAVSWLGDLTGAQWAGLVGGVLALSLLASLVWLVVHLLGQSGRLLVRIEALEARLTGGGTALPAAEIPATPPAGLPVGVPAPTFSLPGLHSETLTLDALRAPGKPVLLLFTDPDCGPCNALLPEISRWQREHAAQMTIALMSRGGPDANRAKSAEHGLTHVLVQNDREVAEAYQSDVTPSAVLVQPDGTIGSLLVEGAEAIRALVARAAAGPPAAMPTLEVVVAGAPHANGNGRCPRCGQVHQHGAAAPAPPAADRVGQPAPALRLPNLAGNTVDLADFRGSKMLVLFWDPGCGFCQRMLPDLKAWEAKPPKGAPKLLVVSTGTVEDNQAMGLRAPVVLDQGFTAGRAFGADGTPQAVLVDEQGRIASSLAEGAPAVLALAGARQDQAKPA